MAAREEANAKRQTVANTKAERKTVRRLCDGGREGAVRARAEVAVRARANSVRNALADYTYRPSLPTATALLPLLQLKAEKAEADAFASKQAAREHERTETLSAARAALTEASAAESEAGTALADLAKALAKTQKEVRGGGDGGSSRKR
jgi:hypothetical protein